MMKVYKYPTEGQWAKLLQRPCQQHNQIVERVQEIVESVCEKGDLAVQEFTQQFDKVKLQQFAVSQNEIEEANELVSPKLKEAISLAQKNIEKFHLSQRVIEPVVHTMPGVSCWRKPVPIESVGLYIPAGTAPLFSTVLMLGIPAKIAGCKNIILCSPPNKQGKVHPTVLYTAQLVGVNNIFKVGGAQAIAAMAYGTETIPKMDKIFGPGNQYVTQAKLQVQKSGVAIDMPAGPSELLIVADESGNPKYIAADLLSQAEHGPDSQVLLVTDNELLLQQTMEELEKQLTTLPRKETAKMALQNSKGVLLGCIDDCFKLSNSYAPEHLIIASEKAKQWQKKVVNAGSVFVGNYSCESAGDYATGTNHTLPTNGFAKGYSGVSVDSFVKKITFQEVTKQGLASMGNAIETIAEAEKLIAHKRAVSIRLNNV